jgi:hypothetical protein
MAAMFFMNIAAIARLAPSYGIAAVVRPVKP